MKRLVIVGIIFFNLFLLYSENISFVVKKDTYAESPEINEEDIFVPALSEFTVSIENMSWYSVDNYENVFLLWDDNKGLGYNASDLIVKNEVYLNQKLKEASWIPDYYLEIINHPYNSGINILYTHEPYWKKWPHMGFAEEEEDVWYYSFHVIRFFMGDFYFYATHNWYYEGMNVFAPLNKIEENEYIYNVIGVRCGVNQKNPDCWQPGFEAFYTGKIPYKVIFVQDGDYMNVYIDSVEEKNRYFTLIRATKDMCEQIEHFVKQKPYDKSKIIWPRHADGTCDYDGSAKPAVAASSGKQQKSPPAVNAVLAASDNLRLRSAGSMSGTTVVTVAKGTSVKVLQLGGSATIDGITSNWVQVEVQSGAKDRDGRSIKAGTTGWCFGGYLK